MTYSSRMVAISHLSDAQECINLGLQVRANNEINFAKLILMKYHNDTEVKEEELNELWNKFIQKNH